MNRNATRRVRCLTCTLDTVHECLNFFTPNEVYSSSPLRGRISSYESVRWLQICQLDRRDVPARPQPLRPVQPAATAAAALCCDICRLVGGLMRHGKPTHQHCIHCPMHSAMHWWRCGGHLHSDCQASMQLVMDHGKISEQVKQSIEEPLVRSQTHLRAALSSQKPSGALLPAAELADGQQANRACGSSWTIHVARSWVPAVYIATC